MPADKHTLPFVFTIPDEVPERPKAPAPPAEKAPPKEPVVFRVSGLARAIQGALDATFFSVLWVEGEVSGLRWASSGHVYFTLKDGEDDAAVDVVMYRSAVTPKTKKLLVEGAKVKLKAKPTFWAPRGRLQLVADRVELSGRGALLEALEQLKAKLEQEGLFALEKKRALPREPRVIGVVSSASGAVIHDIRKVAFRRGGARILLSPCVVQGTLAPTSIVRAIKALCRVHEVDVIIVARGGGSADDLMCFNDEAVVRAVAACPVPIVSAVGHEVDVTLTDFAADARAATPSQAAEMIVADVSALAGALREHQYRLERAMRSRLSGLQASLLRAEKKMGDPRVTLGERQQRLDDLRERMSDLGRQRVRSSSVRLSKLQTRLHALHPKASIARSARTLDARAERLRTLIRKKLAHEGRLLAVSASALDALSPLRVLGRGYALALSETGTPIRRAVDTSEGEKLRVLLSEGAVGVTVTKVEPSRDS